MKTKHIITGLTLLALSTFNSQLSTAFAQGSLTPPGAPAPTMKSADQIEPRTIINAVNTPGDSGNLFIITNSGSYYLTTNLVGVIGKSGIKITANNVTVDLNGFAVQGPGALSGVGGVGISIPGAQNNITLRNGTISDWQYYGVEGGSSSSINLVFERLNIFYGGECGIYLAGPGVVRDCNSYGNPEYGITCNGGIVSGCTADQNGYGIYIGSGTVSGCTADQNGYGIYIRSGTVSGCSANTNNYGGIYVAGDGGVVIGNTCIGNVHPPFLDGVGIYINGNNTRVEDNHVTASGGAGIQVESGYTNNIIIKNSVSVNGANNYVLPGAQIVGPIITNTVSGIITNSNPWANFSF